MPKELTIKVTGSTGIEMEKNLNRAIEDLGRAFTTKGFRDMELVAHEDIGEEMVPVYQIDLKDKI